MRSALLAINQVPSVARKGRIRQMRIRKALSRPISTPPSRAQPTAACHGRCQVFRATRAKAAPKSSATPTDRSIAPALTIRVIAIATISRIALPCSRLAQLSTVKNTGFAQPNRAMASRMMTPNPARDSQASGLLAVCSADAEVFRVI